MSVESKRETEYTIARGCPRVATPLAKRVFDTVTALILMLVSSPLWLLAAIGILISDGRPIFYQAKRVGRGGTVIEMPKFRSMKNRQSAEDGPAITAPGDKRIFPFGKFLRATKIDELPQLLSVVSGALSFVGPRPEDPKIVETYYDGEMWKSLQIVPGLTSAGTIFYMKNFRHVVSIEDSEKSYASNILAKKLAMDMEYEKTSNVFRDIRLIFKTAVVVFSVIIENEFLRNKRSV